jgi:hypothetical protein
MNTWILGTNGNGSKYIRTRIDYFNEFFVAQRIGPSWTPPEIRIGNTSKPTKDFMSWMLSAPVMSEKAIIALSQLIDPHCEILKLIKIKKIQYFALNVITVVDCLIRQESDIVYRSNDPLEVMNIWTFALDEAKIPQDIPIFKIPDDNFGTVFVRRSFADVVIQHGLTGASFMDPRVNSFGPILKGLPLNVIFEVLD